MPKPSLRTRSQKRAKTRTPSGSTVTHYRKGKVGAAKCAICGRALSGPRLSVAAAGKLPKTAKRPERIYGGQICGGCLREIIKQTVRGAS